MFCFVYRPLAELHIISQRYRRETQIQVWHFPCSVHHRVYMLLSERPFKNNLLSREWWKRCETAGAEGRWDNLYNWRRRQRRRVTEGGWNLHVFDGDWRHHLHKQWGGGWQHLLHDECVCEGCPHTRKWHFESSSRLRHIRTMTCTNTSEVTCTHKEISLHIFQTDVI